MIYILTFNFFLGHSQQCIEGIQLKTLTNILLLFELQK